MLITYPENDVVAEKEVLVPAADLSIRVSIIVHLLRCRTCRNTGKDEMANSGSKHRPQHLLPKERAKMGLTHTDSQVSKSILHVPYQCESRPTTKANNNRQQLGYVSLPKASKKTRKVFKRKENVVFSGVFKGPGSLLGALWTLISLLPDRDLTFTNVSLEKGPVT